MGDTAKVIEFRAAPHVVPTCSLGSAQDKKGRADFARLLPGISWERSRRKPPFSVRTMDSTAEDGCQKVHPPHSFSEQLKPRVFERFQPAMLPSLLADLTLIGLVFVSERRWLGEQWHGVFSLHVLATYLLAFFVFSVEEKLYSTRAQLSNAQASAAVRALALATLLASFGSHPASFRAAFTTLAVFSTGNLVVLLGLRLLLAHTGASGKPVRNVLIIGSGAGPRQIATAIDRDEASARLVKGFMEPRHLRNIYGPAMLSRIAREHFIDELLVVSHDPEILNLAIREASENLLDVSVAPAVSKSNDISLEIVDGMALLGLQTHHTPQYALAVKRSLDAALSLMGMIVLSPVFVIAALAVKADSPGPILYRAARIGRKGQSFVCYKFRTMVRDAAAMKNELRSRNQRQGAFFKIEGDPRITRTGRLLRRYSLDELPQLWNVLLGHMSLVGPRPHPPEDVSLYNVHDLQRLDFVPGMTGLWQVTARRDPSFERNVALDVEYIRTWNLWLDVRILWRTIFAVLEGSGA